MIMLEPTNLTNAIYTVHKWKICSLEFSSTRYLCAHVPMHVPLRRKAILQCHKFDAKLISNLKVASMSAHINYLLLFFCFLVFSQSKIRIRPRMQKSKTMIRVEDMQSL